MNYVIIFFLGLLFPGFGNLYIKDIKNSIIYFLLTPILFIVFLQYLSFSFVFYVIFWLLIIILKLTAIIQPLYKYSKNKQSMKMRYGIILIVIALISTLLIPTNDVAKIFKYRSIKITSESMMDTLSPGDRFVGDYNVDSVKDGDVFIFQENGMQYISRCIAQDGESISIKNGVVYVNNIEIHEPYVYKDTTIIKDQDIIPDEFINLKEYKVEKNMIFILGDNRYNSDDSRFKRMVNKDNVIGKPLYFYYSIDHKKIGRKIK